MGIFVHNEEVEEIIVPPKRKCKICNKPQTWVDTGWGTGYYICPGKDKSCEQKQEEERIKNKIQSNIDIIEKFNKIISLNKNLRKNIKFPLVGRKEDVEELKKHIPKFEKVFIVEDLFEFKVVTISSKKNWEEIGYTGYGQLTLSPLDSGETILSYENKKGLSILESFLSRKDILIEIARVFSKFTPLVNLENIEKVIIQEHKGRNSFRPDFKYGAPYSWDVLLYIPKNLNLQKVEKGVYWAKVGPIKRTNKKDKKGSDIFIREVYQIQKA